MLIPRVLLMTYDLALFPLFLFPVNGKSYFWGVYRLLKHFGDGVGQGGGGESLIICHLWRDVSKTLERGTRKDWAGKEGRGKRSRIRNTEDRELGTGKKRNGERTGPSLHMLPLLSTTALTVALKFLVNFNFLKHVDYSSFVLLLLCCTTCTNL